MRQGTSTTPLLDRIGKQSEPIQIRPVRRVPRWLARAQEQGFTPQDRTAYIHGAFTPSGSDGAA